MADAFAITTEAIDADAVRAAVLGPESGAVVVFHGTVRERTLDRRVTYLEYEAYEPMALKAMTAIADDLVREHGVAAIACTHRVGRLDIGDDAMVVAVASPHRAAALAATADFIARLKQDVPIWKKEHFVGGAIWIGSPEDPQGEGSRPPEEAGA